MKNIPILIALLLPVVSVAQNLPYWQDVDVTNVNAETRRTEAIWFASRADALSKGFRQSENYVDLNGTWDFKYFDDYHEMERFLGSARNDRGETRNDKAGTDWDRIHVPGNWEVQGFGVPIYVNHPYEFSPRDPQPPTLPISPVSSPAHTSR